MGTSTAAETLNRRPPKLRLSFAWWWWLIIGLIVFFATGSLFVVTYVSRRQTAMAEINRLGWFGETRPGEPGWLRDNLPSGWHRWFDDPRVVVLDRPGVTDETLRHVGRFSTLERVWVKRAAITDAGLRHLAGLSELTDLALIGADITDEGLQELSELNKLDDLSLAYTRITDAGLASLTSLKTLDSLGLDGTEVSDAGIGHLLSLSKLRYLGIEETRITEQGIARLRGLPSLRILSLDSTQLSDSVQTQLAAFPSLEALRINNRQVVDLPERRLDLFAETQSIADLGVLLNSGIKRQRHFEEHGGRFREDDRQLSLILQELVARGGNEAEQLLLSKLGRLDLGAEAEFKYEYHGEHDNQLDYLTALRRLQRRPDPLSISVQLPRNLKADTRSLPKLTVMLRSLDVERLALFTRIGFDLEDPKWDSAWRFEVRNSSGELLPVRSHHGGTPNPGTAGRIVGWFRFGEFAYAVLPMEEYIEIPEAGEYTVTIVYRPRGFPGGTAEEPEDAQSLITFRSAPFKLKVDPAPTQNEPAAPPTVPER